MRKSFAVAGAIGLLLGLALCAQAVTTYYNLWTDYVPNHLPATGIGPNGVWSYGWDSDANGVLLSPFSFSAMDMWNPSGLRYPGSPEDGYHPSFTWNTWGHTVPAVLHRTADGVVGVFTLSVGFIWDQVCPVMIRFTAPYATTEYIDMAFYYNIYNNVDALIGFRKNNDAPFFLQSAVANGGYFAWGGAVPVQAGDVLDLFVAVAPGMPFGTYIDGIRWTSADNGPIPEPSSLLVLGSGLLGLGGVLLRKRS